ncbi:MAG: T9SS type A sorting domain-containing protein, partial [Ginsengibacter sp.]
LLISQLANPKMGFICGDSLLIYWNSIPRAESYLVYTLGAQYMQAIKNISDTSIILTKAQVAAKFIAVAPIIAKDTGTRSYAFRYDLQASGCYINSFFAVSDGSNVMLTLSIGTTYLIDSTSFEIQEGGHFKTIYTTGYLNQFSYQYNFPFLKEGVNYFRARIKLSNGTIIYSTVQSVIYIRPGNYILAPNPLRKNQTLNIYSGGSGDATFYLYDAEGRLIFVKQISAVYEFIDLHHFHSGLYFFVIKKANVKKATGKLVIIE